MAIGIAVKAEQRANHGTSQARRMRHTGVLPGVVYGDGKPGLNIQMDRHQFEKTMGSHLSEHPILDLDVTGVSPKKVLLQEVQYHPVTGQVIHVDFHEVSMTKKLKVAMAIRLVGEPHGVVQQGGVLEHLLRTVTIECLPGDILEHVDVDVSAMAIGDTLNVGDIKLDAAKYRVISDTHIAVAGVTAPREEEAAAATTAATAAEPEVLREKKDLEGEGAEAGAKKEAGGKDGAKKEAPAAKDAAAKGAPKAAAPKAAGKEAKK